MTWERHGEALLPVGTIYDCFLGRALEPWSFGIYSGGQFILVGTPSGVTLAPEGGAHQSVVSALAALGQPGCLYWEPAFAQDLEWTFLAALSRLARQDGQSSYFRLSTRPVDQAHSPVPDDPSELARRRDDVLGGAYRLRGGGDAPPVRLVGAGAVMPEVCQAADALGAEQIEVVCVTSPDLITQAQQSRRGLSVASTQVVDRLFAPDDQTPTVVVMDAHLLTLGAVGSLTSGRVTCLGPVTSGSRARSRTCSSTSASTRRPSSGRHWI